MLEWLCNMKMYAVFLLMALLATSLSSAIPKPGEEEHKSRVVEHELSEQEHFLNGDQEAHNPEYDHEAFLGREDADTFDQLSPEESKRKLGLIYDKMDKDSDGKVTEEELRNWIRHVQNRYIWSDTERQWKDHDPQEDKLSWQNYKQRTYGFLEEKDGKEESYDYIDMVRRDERRWNRADQDRDEHLTKEEFADFLHPEEAESMRDIVIDETLEDIDKNKDGKISLEEYIGDMWPNYDKGDEPDWVKNEREQFATFRDKNKDGEMDREEVQDWILPADYDHSEAEAKHLIFESDTDRDGWLTKEEVVEKYDIFVGSQATDFGEALERHDEF